MYNILCALLSIFIFYKITFNIMSIPNDINSIIIAYGTYAIDDGKCDKVKLIRSLQFGIVEIFNKYKHEFKFTAAVKHNIFYLACVIEDYDLMREYSFYNISWDKVLKFSEDVIKSIINRQSPLDAARIINKMPDSNKKYNLFMHTYNTCGSITKKRISRLEYGKIHL